MDGELYKLFDTEFIFENLADFLAGENDDVLFECAGKVRREKYNNDVYIRGIIDISNYCMCNCKFCGNACTSKIDRYRLKTEQIIKSIKSAQEDGVDLIHLAAGVDNKINDKYLMPVLQYCEENGIDVEMAVGIKDIEIYDRLILKGVHRFIVKFETSNKVIFEDVKVCHNLYEEYIAFIRELKKKKVFVGSGNIIGLPGTSIEDMCNDIRLLSDLDLDMVSTSVFTANKESVFCNEKNGDKNLALRFIALANLIYNRKNISIPSNSSFGLDNKIKGMQLGANVLSVNYTNAEYEKNYSIYEGGDRIRANLLKTKEYINSAGMRCVSWKEFKKL